MWDMDSHLLTLFRVGVVGMGPLTLLGQWARAIDDMFENERIVNTTVLIDQTYQEICPTQVGFCLWCLRLTSL